MPHRDMRHGETRKLEKTGPIKKRTSVESEPRPRHEKPCLETVFRQDTCLQIPYNWLLGTYHTISLQKRWPDP